MIPAHLYLHVIIIPTLPLFFGSLKALDKDGICAPGEKVDDRQVLVNKAMPVVSTTTPGKITT